MTATAQAAAALAAVLFGLAGAAAADLAGRRGLAHALRLLSGLASAVFAAGVAIAGPLDMSFGSWMEVGGASVGFSLRGDGTAAAAVGSAAALCLVYPLAQPGLDGPRRALITATTAGVVLLSCAADWFPLLLGWEIAAAALLVTAATSTAVSGAGARRLLWLTRIGSVALVAAAVTTLAAGGAHDGIDWTAPPTARLVALAAVIALGAWPLHQWILEASPCPAASAAAAALTVAGAGLLARVGPGPGPLQEAVFGFGLAAAAAASAAALASRGLRRIPAWIAVAQAGLIAAAMAAGPPAGWLLLAAALCARLCLSAGMGRLQAAVPAAERLDELGGLAASLPAARWLCLAGALTPVLSLTGLWGQALLLQHALGGYGSAGLGVALPVLALAVLPLVRLALPPFAGSASQVSLEELDRPALPVMAGLVPAGLAFAALPALSWWWLAPPPAQGLALAAAANAAAVGISVLIWRRGLKPAPGPASASRRLATGGFGALAAQQAVYGAATSLVRGLWTFADSAVIGGAWGALDLIVRGAGWLLARAEHAHRPVWAAALAAGTALAVLWSMGD